MTDYYATLGIARNASPDEIQKAYRALARKYHPDLNPDDKTAKVKFQEVQSAFDVLGDEKKRGLYDRYGSNFESMGAGAPGAGPHSWQGPTGDGQQYEFDLSDLFGGGGPTGGPGMGDTGGGFADLFKQFGQRGASPGTTQRRAPQDTRGSNIEHEFTVPFNTAITGGEAAISVRRASGKLETITVKIPPGIEDGKKIRLRGQGEPSPSGGKPGDILITVRISSHPYFQRRGNRLDVRVPVTLSEAVGGAKIDVPTPTGIITLSIPPGTSGGKKLRIKGHGVRQQGAEPGDLFAEIQIVLPTSLSEEERERVLEILSKHGENPRTELRW